eukprot:CAMPEP_0170543270 /NCGR_PEP_ID=MMETSP0211-20121228/2443_1 /TAXON_ID=311385 /ORGANISM="Pseudokeronopsis sp., Strain OXSARD2" /LENGTH=65 /DNA_ID=CAMNT_0010846605 /DNA_START=198 /DNA_END=395 /DNA_ORIENTATION=+
MQSNAPIINFPANFEMVLSNNDPGFNLTEIIYMDGNKEKMRIQLYYSILGLDQTKAFDIIIDEKE